VFSTDFRGPPIDARDRLAIIKVEQAAMNHFQYRGAPASDPWAKMGATKGDGHPFSLALTHSKTAFHRKEIGWLSPFLARISHQMARQSA